MLEVLLSANPLSLAVVFIYGTLFGSFLNVVIYRMPLERSIVWPGSACGICGTPLVWWQNVPVLSYLALGGCCHTCGSRFSPRYAFVELATGLAAAGLLHHHGRIGIPFVYHFVFFCFLAAVFFMDLDHWIILDQVSLPGAALGLLGATLMPFRDDGLLAWLQAIAGWGPEVPIPVWNLLSSVVGIVMGATLFWSVQVVGTFLARQDALGGGDVKLAAMMGAFLGGAMGMVSFLLSFFLGAAVAVPLMLLRRRRGKDPVPLGTFMAVAAFVTVLWGDRLLVLFLDWPSYLPMS